MMGRFLVALVALVVAALPAAAQDGWSGNWTLHWQGGGAVVSLVQNAGEVRGGDASGALRIEGAAQGTELRANLTEAGETASFSAYLQRGAEGFTGFTNDGRWLTGARSKSSELSLSLSSPREAMSGFLIAANRAAAGQNEAWSEALDAVSFGPDPNGDWSTPQARLDAVKALYALVDRATFTLSRIPTDGTSPMLVSLPVIGAESIVLRFIKTPASWQIMLPTRDELEQRSAQAVRQAGGADRGFATPRDTLRTFLNGMAQWKDGGRNRAVAALDLSQIPAAIQAEQGGLSAQFLVRVLDRLSVQPLQSVPNSADSRDAFVLFEHPAGKITIAPVTVDGNVIWKFSSATIATLPQLFRALDALPPVHRLDPGLVPQSGFFDLRAWVAAHAPALLESPRDNGLLEYWQISGALAAPAAIVLLALIIRLIVLLLVGDGSFIHLRQPRHFAAAAGLACAILLISRIVPWLGLPAASRQYTVPLFGSILILAMLYAAWQMVSALASFLEDYTEKTESQIDNILLTFSTGLIKLGLAAGAGLALSAVLSIPTTGVIAGLGVSGVAVAFASRETIANLFGAGILLGDRPFVTGDKIIAGEFSGRVEAVGLRSTRIRAHDDSLLVVPNGKLADMIITNLGRRRLRRIDEEIVVVSGVTSAKIVEFAGAVRRRIASDPDVHSDDVEVQISGIHPDGVRLKILGTVVGKDSRGARDVLNRLYPDIMDLATSAGMSLGKGFLPTTD